jgi:2-dehydro-3-deoxygluconokinase
MTEPRVWTIGEALAVLVPDDIRPAEQAERLRVGVGGAELNTAIGLARLGHSVSWVGVVGDDPWGRKITRELLAEGVDARARIDTSAATGAYLRERRAAGLIRATYLRTDSAGSHLALEDLERVELASGDMLHLTGITPALSDSALRTWLAAAEKARSLDCRVSLDVNYRSALWSRERAREALEKILPLVDTVLVGDDELSILVDAADDAAEAGAALTRSLPSGCELVVKNGPRGSLHYNSQRRMTTGHALAAAVVDVVGAGDSFAAGYLSAQLEALPPAARLERAHSCAAFVVATQGDWEGAPRRSELPAATTLNATEVTR